MAKSLNAYASRIAHIIGQPDNQALKERAKDMIKDYFAKYIIQSIDKNGITPFYKVNLKVEMVAVTESNVLDADGNEYYTKYKSSTKLPKPLNIKNDSVFTRVALPTSGKVFSYVPKQVFLMSSTLAPTGSARVYTYYDDVIYIKQDSRTSIPVRYIWGTSESNQNFVRYLDIETIWENPEDVIGYYSIDDNQDLDLPFPNEMLNFVIADILKVEFNIIPKDIEVDKK